MTTPFRRFPIPTVDATNFLAAAQAAQAGAEAARDQATAVSVLTDAVAGRAAAVASSADVQRVNVKTPGGATISYVRDDAGTALVRNDGVRFSPDGVPTPDHWAENTLPGITDMTAAAVACQAWSNRVYLLASRYALASDALVFDEDAPVLIGAGVGQSVIVDTSTTGDLVSFTDNDGGAIYNAQIGRFTVQGNTARAGGWHITGGKRFINSWIGQIELLDWFNGLRLYASAKTFVTDIICEIRNRPTKAGKGIEIFADAANPGRPSDLHIHNVQVVAPDTGASWYTNAINIAGCDGVYMSKVHTINGDNGLRVAPSTTGDADVLASLFVTDCYFDRSYGDNVIFLGDTNLAKKYRKIQFKGGQIRESRGANGGLVIATDTVVEELILSDLHIDGCYRSGVRCAETADLANVTITGCQFSANNSQAVSSHADLYVSATGATIVGNSFVGGSDTAIRSIGTNAVIASNNLTASTAAAKIVAPSDAVIRGNAGYVTKTHGSVAFSASASQTVSHGLSATPTAGQISLTAISASGTGGHVSNITSTTFDIVFASPVTATVHWRADIEG